MLRMILVGAVLLVGCKTSTNSTAVTQDAGPIDAAAREDGKKGNPLRYHPQMRFAHAPPPIEGNRISEPGLRPEHGNHDPLQGDVA